MPKKVSLRLAHSGHKNGAKDRLDHKEAGKSLKR
jgi:hypothetical protein